ncbi:MAG: SEC-C domain-containing protein [Clostridiales bacterium]|nr:SEC-C domain-containing protein [Clostridiales bacterium]
MLEEWPGIRAQFQILKQDYPDYYRYFRDYAAELEQGPDVDPLRQRLLKDYIRLARQFEEAPYFRDYPERLRSLYTVSWDSGANGAYRRDGKKIGRNDPCPCGSGKKYKNCCGRN